MTSFNQMRSPVLQSVSSSRKRLENLYISITYAIFSPVLQFVFSPVSVSHCFLTVSPVLQLPCIYKYITGDPSGSPSLFIHIDMGAAARRSRLRSRISQLVLRGLKEALLPSSATQLSALRAPISSNPVEPSSVARSNTGVALH